jgi:SAM-dependent methyltransferase
MKTGREGKTQRLPWQSFIPGLECRPMESEEYRKMAAVEDAMWYYRALHAHLHRALAPFLGRRPARILDAGCGSGGLIRRLSPLEPAWQWTGVDVSPLACELARGRCQADIREASVTALPFPDASFDAVVSADVLYHVEDDTAALREFARVVRPAGRVVINVPAHRWLWSYHDVATHAKRRYTTREVRAKMQAAGWANIRATHWNALPLPLVILRRKLMPAPESGSDVRLYPAPVETAFKAAMALERAWLGTMGTLPLGSSILAMGQVEG